MTFDGRLLFVVPENGFSFDIESLRYIFKVVIAQA